eukprot:scaffold19784_cov57-Phaeocystis_antarctica.AAC.7
MTSMVARLLPRRLGVAATTRSECGRDPSSLHLVVREDLLARCALRGDGHGHLEALQLSLRLSGQRRRNRRPWAGTRAPPPPLAGTHAARARLSGLEGRPKQAGRLPERYSL